MLSSSNNFGHSNCNNRHLRLEMHPTGAQRVTICVHLSVCVKVEIHHLSGSNLKAPSQPSVSSQTAISQQSVSHQSAVSHKSHYKSDEFRVIQLDPKILCLVLKASLILS